MAVLNDLVTWIGDASSGGTKYWDDTIDASGFDTATKPTLKTTIDSNYAVLSSGTATYQTTVTTDEIKPILAPMYSYITFKHLIAINTADKPIVPSVIVAEDSRNLFFNWSRTLPEFKSLYAFTQADTIIGFTVPAFNGAFPGGYSATRKDVISWSGALYTCIIDTALDPTADPGSWTITPTGLDGYTFDVTAGAITKTFELDTDASVSGANIAVDISASTSNNAIAVAAKNAINGSGLLATATSFLFTTRIKNNSATGTLTFVSVPLSIPEWDSGTTYSLNDLVYFSGVVYKSILDAPPNLNFQPDTDLSTIPPHWALEPTGSGDTLILDDGRNPATTFEYVNVGAWSALTTYNIHDRITFVGKYYVSLQGSNINQNPLIKDDYWLQTDNVGVISTHIPINMNGLTLATQARSATNTAINDVTDPLLITSSAPGNLELTNDYIGSDGNIPITGTAIGGAITLVSGMDGGSLGTNTINGTIPTTPISYATFTDGTGAIVTLNEYNSLNSDITGAATVDQTALTTFAGSVADAIAPTSNYMSYKQPPVTLSPKTAKYFLLNDMNFTEVLTFFSLIVPGLN